MLAKVFSAAVCGVEAHTIEVEVHAGRGESGKVVVVGLPDVAVKECKDRVTTAVLNSGYYTNPGQTTINLAPADIRKEGPIYDLPIAIGMLVSTDQLKSACLDDYFVVGELALNGSVRSVRGVLPMAMRARAEKKRGIIVPAQNAAEAAVVMGLDVYPVSNLRDAADFLQGKKEIDPVYEDLVKLFSHEVHYDLDFSDVKGQQDVKRALEVAVAGGHNLLMIGPPGSGKSMLAKRIPTIMPAMTLDEALETTKVHSVAGILPLERALVTTRPFRSPHHTISDIGLVGGSSQLRPGEVSTAHNGVLFLDELPEFKRQTLEILRQPLEDRRVTITRAVGSVSFPCNFMLIAAMNPSPSGVYGDNSAATRRYLDKISRPLLDRLDIHIEVPGVKYAQLASAEMGETSESIRTRVEQARNIQQVRFGSGRRKVYSNAGMGAKDIRNHCQLKPEVQEMLKMAMNELNFSARAYDRILKVARTIADLAGGGEIGCDHIGEAIQYRTLDRTLWQ